MKTEILYRDKHPNKYKMSGWVGTKKVFIMDFSLEKPLSDQMELFRFTHSLEESEGIFFVGDGRFDYINRKSFENYSIEERR